MFVPSLCECHTWVYVVCLIKVTLHSFLNRPNQFITELVAICLSFFFISSAVGRVVNQFLVVHALEFIFSEQIQYVGVQAFVWGGKK